jgi:glycosyltransferase involved in cell wall biosynthesis
LPLEKIVLFIGRFTENKGPLRVLQALISCQAMVGVL